MEEIFLMIYFYKHIRWMLPQQYPIVIFVLNISSCTLANDTHVNRILSLKMPLHASKKKKPHKFIKDEMYRIPDSSWVNKILCLIYLELTYIDRRDLTVRILNECFADLDSNMKES